MNRRLSAFVRPTPRKAENKGDDNEDIFPDITLVMQGSEKS